MILAAVVFIVLMVLWLVYGASSYDSTRKVELGGTLIPWACVAILGWAVFRGLL